MANKSENGSNLESLSAVSEKKREWALLPVTEKLAVLEEILSILTKEIEFGEWKDVGKATAEMMGYPENTAEGRAEAAAQTFLLAVVAKDEIEHLLFAYRVRAGIAKPPKQLTKGNFRTRRAINGQVVVETFPILPVDKMGIAPHIRGEVWMDPTKIRDESEVEAFSFEKAWGDEHAADKQEGGLAVVLGAGNYNALTVSDVAQAMFVRNYVVYLKQHPLRKFVTPFLKRIFAPLMERGYLAMEDHTTNERVAALVYHPSVDALHITGGKQTHDLLVWGADPSERKRNIQNNTPRIKNVTSELGAVSPWVVVPGKYTPKQLETQASIIAMFGTQPEKSHCS